MPPKPWFNIVGREECLSDILDVLRTEPLDRRASVVALYLLTYKRFKQTTPSQMDEIRELNAMYLKSPAPELRIATGMSIRDVGGPWAISQLRAAIDVEQDEAVRNALAKDLVSVGR